MFSGHLILKIAIETMDFQCWQWHLLGHGWCPIFSPKETRVAFSSCPVEDPSPPIVERARECLLQAGTITYESFLKEIVQSTIIGSHWMHPLGTCKTLKHISDRISSLTLQVTFSSASEEFRLDADRIEPVVCHWDESIVPFSLVMAAVVLLLLWMHILEYEINLKKDRTNCWFRWLPE